jgi:TonB family protein
MRWQAPLLMLIANATSAQPSEPTVPAPAPAPASPCTEQARSAACECTKKWLTTSFAAGFPRAAIKAGLNSGEATVSFTFNSEGVPSEIVVTSASHYVFEDAATRMVKQLKCAPETQGIHMSLPLSFRID